MCDDGLFHQLMLPLKNIICCYLALGDSNNAIKYWKKYLNRINKLEDKNLIKYSINNTTIGLLTNFEYFNMANELNELISLLKLHNTYDNKTVNKLVEYHALYDFDFKVNFIEKELLPSLLGKAHFSYCKWLLDTCVRYFKEKRMYKKDIDFETEYLELFRKYYFY